jgi:hypothetical protein
MQIFPGDPVPIVLRYRTDDSVMRGFAQRYWAAYYGNSETFQYKENVGALAEEFGFTLHEAISKVAEVVVAIYGQCGGCNRPLLVRTRNDLRHRVASKHPIFCTECLDQQAAARDKEREEFRARELQEQQRRQQAAKPTIEENEIPLPLQPYMRDIPSINQVALMGKIKAIKHKPGRIFCWTFDVTIYKEYGSTENDVEAEVTCGVGNDGYGERIANANVGDWVTLQGKLRSGFIQVRSMCLFPFSPQ